MLEAGAAAAEAGGVLVGVHAPSPGQPLPACRPLPHAALSRTLSHVLVTRPRAGPSPAQRSSNCLAGRTACGRPTRRPVFSRTGSGPGPFQTVRRVGLLTPGMEPRETRLSRRAVCNRTALPSTVVSDGPGRLLRTRAVPTGLNAAPPPSPCAASGPLGVLRRSLANEKPQESVVL